MRSVICMIWMYCNSITALRFSAALNQHWQGQRAAALAAAEIAATRVLRALHGGKTRKAIRENQA